MELTHRGTGQDLDNVLCKVSVRVLDVTGPDLVPLALVEIGLLDEAGNWKGRKIQAVEVDGDFDASAILVTIYHWKASAMN